MGGRVWEHPFSGSELRTILELPYYRGTGRNMDIDTLRKCVPTDLKDVLFRTKKPKLFSEQLSIVKAFVLAVRSVSS